MCNLKTTMSLLNPNYHHGIRRTIRVYGQVDPVMEARRKRHEKDYGSTLMRPHSGLATSVKPETRFEGDARVTKDLVKAIVDYQRFHERGAHTPLKPKTRGRRVRGE